jgi:hypothetical protein
MSKTRTAPKTSKSKFPKSIQNMIQRAYLRGETSHQAASRINETTLASRLGVELSPAQVAAAFAWITMRSAR